MVGDGAVQPLPTDVQDGHGHDHPHVLRQCRQSQEHRPEVQAEEEGGQVLGDVGDLVVAGHAGERDDERRDHRQCHRGQRW